MEAPRFNAVAREESSLTPGERVSSLFQPDTLSRPRESFVLREFPLVLYLWIGTNFGSRVWGFESLREPKLSDAALFCMLRSGSTLDSRPNRIKHAGQRRNGWIGYSIDGGTD